MYSGRSTPPATAVESAAAPADASLPLKPRPPTVPKPTGKIVPAGFTARRPAALDIVPLEEDSTDDEAEVTGKPKLTSIFSPKGSIPINLKPTRKGQKKVIFASPRNTVIEVPMTVTNQLARSIWRASRLLGGVAEEVSLTRHSATGKSVSEQYLIVLDPAEYDAGARLASNAYLTPSNPRAEHLEEYEFTHSHDPEIAGNGHLYPKTAVAAIELEATKPEITHPVDLKGRKLQLMVWHDEVGGEKANVLSIPINMAVPVADSEDPDDVETEESKVWLNLPNVNVRDYIAHPIIEVLAVPRDLMPFCMPGMHPVKVAEEYALRIEQEALEAAADSAQALARAEALAKNATTTRKKADVAQAIEATAQAGVLRDRAGKLLKEAKEAKAQVAEAKTAAKIVPSGLREALEAIGEQISIGEVKPGKTPKYGNRERTSEEELAHAKKPILQTLTERRMKRVRAKEADASFAAMAALPLKMDPSVPDPKASPDSTVSAVTGSPTDPVSSPGSLFSPPGTDPAPVMASPPGAANPKAMPASPPAPFGVGHAGARRASVSPSVGLGQIARAGRMEVSTSPTGAGSADGRVRVGFAPALSPRTGVGSINPIPAGMRPKITLAASVSSGRSLSEALDAGTSALNAVKQAEKAIAAHNARREAVARAAYKASFALPEPPKVTPPVPARARSVSPYTALAASVSNHCAPTATGSVGPVFTNPEAVSRSVSAPKGKGIVATFMDTLAAQMPGAKSAAAPKPAAASDLPRSEGGRALNSMLLLTSRRNPSSGGGGTGPVAGGAGKR